jgi:hypothetical protein
LEILQFQQLEGIFGIGIVAFHVNLSCALAAVAENLLNLLQSDLVEVVKVLCNRMPNVVITNLLLPLRPYKVFLAFSSGQQSVGHTICFSGCIEPNSSFIDSLKYLECIGKSRSDNPDQ